MAIQSGSLSFGSLFFFCRAGGHTPPEPIQLEITPGRRSVRLCSRLSPSVAGSAACDVLPGRTCCPGGTLPEQRSVPPRGRGSVQCGSSRLSRVCCVCRGAQPHMLSAGSAGVSPRAGAAPHVRGDGTPLPPFLSPVPFGPLPLSFAVAFCLFAFAWGRNPRPRGNRTRRAAGIETERRKPTFPEPRK